MSGDEERDEPTRRSSAPPHRVDGAAETAEQALGRAGVHARCALAESLHAVQALLDAASLATSGAPAETRRVLGPLARALDGIASGLEGDARDGAGSLLAAVAEALDAEIARWELRARDDADARAVLRAFLGVRELLWEFGVRHPQGAGRTAEAAGHQRPRPRRARPRVQRVRV